MHPEKLRAELPGILNRAPAGCPAYQKPAGATPQKPGAPTTTRCAAS